MAKDNETQQAGRNTQDGENLTQGEQHSSQAPTGRRRKSRLVLVIGGAVLVVLAAGLFITSTIVNQRVADGVSEELDALLEEEGLDETISYDSVSVSSLRGRITATGVSAGDPAGEARVEAAQLSIQVPAAEALQLRSALSAAEAGEAPMDSVSFSEVEVSGREISLITPEGPAGTVEEFRLNVSGDLTPALLDDPSAEELLAVTGARAELEGLELAGGAEMLQSVEETVQWTKTPQELFQIDALRVAVDNDRENRKLAISEYALEAPLYEQSGNGSLTYGGTLPEDSWIEDLEFEFLTNLHHREEAIAIAAPELGENIVIDFPAFSLDASGELGFTDKEFTFDPDRLNAEVAVSLGPAAVRMPPALSKEFVAEFPFLADVIEADRFSLENLAFDAQLPSAEEVRLDDLSLDAPFAELELEGSAALDPANDYQPSSLDISGNVERLPPQVRETVAGWAMMMEARIPESGPFSFTLGVDEQGMPTLEVE